MWEMENLGVATWRTDDHHCRFDLRGGGSSFSISGFADTKSSTSSSSVLLSAIEDQVLPLASEQYVRQNRLTINYPQADGLYAIRLSIEPMDSSPDQIVMELTVSIQTDLLDSHPMLDLHAPGSNVASFGMVGEQKNWREEMRVSHLTADSVNTVEGSYGTLAVLLDRHDAPATTCLSDEGQLRLRLFGDFLEKGVIRTARPWIVMHQGNSPLDKTPLLRRYQDLEQRPLPLAT